MDQYISDCKSDADWCHEIPPRDCYVDQDVCCEECTSYYTGIQGIQTTLFFFDNVH